VVDGHILQVGGCCPALQEVMLNWLEGDNVCFGEVTLHFARHPSNVRADLDYFSDRRGRGLADGSLRICSTRFPP
jgi:hypothetical protein